MPDITHEQIHELLLGLARVQHVTEQVLIQGPDGRPDAQRHAAYIGVLRNAAGDREAAPTIPQLVARMALAINIDRARAAEQRAWELEQIRRLFPAE